MLGAWREERQPLMGEVSFETALGERIEEMVDACTRCGKCVEACPSVAPAGLADANPVETISGVIDILRGGQGPAGPAASGRRQLPQAGARRPCAAAPAAHGGAIGAPRPGRARGGDPG